MSREPDASAGDYAVFAVVFASIAFVIGMGVGTSTAIQPPLECDPGTVRSRRSLDGELVCWMERTDWRRPVEPKVKRAGRKS